MAGVEVLVNASQIQIAQQQLIVKTLNVKIRVKHAMFVEKMLFAHQATTGPCVVAQQTLMEIQQ